MLETAMAGAIVGAIVGWFAREQWQSAVDRRNARPPILLRHKSSGLEYELVCIAHPIASPMEEMFILIDPKTGHRYAWPEAEVDRVMTGKPLEFLGNG